MAVMTSEKFIQMAKDIATNYKTLYVMGGFGAPLTEANKNRYINGYSYNKQANRAAKIRNASSDTFAFDCVCLIKGILWGWNGDTSKTNGGAIYGSNGVPDVPADDMMSYCTERSSNFSNIIPGEAVHMNGHIGIYIGNGLAVESTPIWKDGVQITAVGNIGAKAGYNTRTWTDHGKLQFIDYSMQPQPTPIPTPSEEFNIGDKVVINGSLYSNAYATSPVGSVSNTITEITLVEHGAPHPYNTTGYLGWMDTSSVSKYEAPIPTPEPEPVPQPEPEPEKPTLAVGDTVKIIGTGNGSCYGGSNVAYGIGWIRQILRIWEGKPYPYQVGNNSGTTGFYPESSLQKQ